MNLSAVRFVTALAWLIVSAAHFEFVVMDGIRSAEQSDARTLSVTVSLTRITAGDDSGMATLTFLNLPGLFLIASLGLDLFLLMRPSFKRKAK